MLALQKNFGLLSKIIKWKLIYILKNIEYRINFKILIFLLFS
jgi:hypothetical protein